MSLQTLQKLDPNLSYTSKSTTGGFCEVRFPSRASFFKHHCKVRQAPPNVLQIDKLLTNSSPKFELRAESGLPLLQLMHEFLASGKPIVEH